MDSNMEDEHLRKFFLGGLSYDTTEESLNNYFGQWGTLNDVVVMRFPDSKRSRGFGFITYSSEEEAQACYESGPHTVDNKQIELKKATPKGQKGSNDETARKIFIGGLSYQTTDDGLRAYFEQFGNIVDCIVMKYKDNNKSRGFGFVTYSDTEMVDAVQQSRPHTIDGAKVETKRATPRDEAGRGESGKNVKKIFIGGFKDRLEDSDLEAYFSNYGTIASAKQVLEKGTGKKLGFGFVEFDDYDPVDKVVLQGSTHHINGAKVDVRKAQDKNDTQGGGDRRGGGRGGGMAPWGGSQGGYGGGNSYGSSEGWGGNQGGYGGAQTGWGGAAQSYGNSWQSGATAGTNAWGGNQGGWGGAQSTGYMSSGAGAQAGGYMASGGGWGGGYNSGSGGGAMRSAGMGGASNGARNAPYPSGGRGGGGGGRGTGGSRW